MSSLFDPTPVSAPVSASLGLIPIRLISKEGNVVNTTYGTASQSGFIKEMLEYEVVEFAQNLSAPDRAIPSVPVSNVDTKTLELVLRFMEHHQEKPMPEIEKPLRENFSKVVPDWYYNFTSVVDQETLFNLILAANYLDLKPLLNLTCAKVASMIKGRTPEEIRQAFGIVNDFTPEEEQKVREENCWCEE